MFLRLTSEGNTYATGPYLWVVMGNGTPFRESRAFVRTVRLRQCGHFMMGRITVGGHVAGLSGAYGSDGLPATVPGEVYDAGVPIPAEIMEAFATGGGHNGPGREGPDLRAWALANLPALRKAGRNLPPNDRERLCGLVVGTSYTHPIAHEISAFRPFPHEVRMTDDESRLWFDARRLVFLNHVHERCLAIATPADIARNPWAVLDKIHPSS